MATTIATTSPDSGESLEWKGKDEPVTLSCSSQFGPGEANPVEAPTSISGSDGGKMPAGEQEGEEDQRIQPWQSLMDEIERESNLSPPGSDYFPCQQGFYAHSLAG